MVALLLATGCAARPSGDSTEGDPCAPVASEASATPSSEAARHVELGDVTCSDADSGMSSLDITVRNTGAGTANYYVTVEFMDSDRHSLATENTYFGDVSAAANMSRTVHLVRPAGGRGLGVRLVKVKREAVAAKTPSPAPSTFLDKAVEVFVAQGLVPAGTPYGYCPATAPQAYWISDRGNCWSAARNWQPPPITATPAQPTLTAPTPVRPRRSSARSSARTAGSPSGPRASSMSGRTPSTNCSTEPGARTC